MPLFNPLGTGPAGPQGATGATGAGMAVWRVDIVPFLGYVVNQGTWGYSEAAGQVLGILDNSTTAINDSVSFTAGFEAGTWELSVMSVTFTNRAIMTVALDGTNVATFDAYAASAVNNVVFKQTGIVVATTGSHTLTITGASKNASSSSYQIALQMITLRRTA